MAMVGTEALPARVHTCVLQESKTFRVTGTKRRRDSGVVVSTNALSNRVTRLARSLKASNPHHVDVQVLGSVLAPSTTGSLYCLANGISQGDDFYQRFGNNVDMSRLLVKGTLIPGSTSTTPSVVRLSVFRAQAGIAFAANLTGSYSPVLSSTSTRLLYDKFYSIPGTYATPGFPVNINLNIKLKHRQKFSGAAAAGQTGDSLFIIAQSDKTAGTTAPAWGSGFMEIWFKP